MKINFEHRKILTKFYLIQSVSQSVSHSFNKQLLSFYYGLDNFLSIRNIALKEIPAPMELILQSGEIDNTLVSKIFSILCRNKCDTEEQNRDPTKEQKEFGVEELLQFEIRWSKTSSRSCHLSTDLKDGKKELVMGIQVERDDQAKGTADTRACSRNSKEANYGSSQKY